MHILVCNDDGPPSTHSSPYVLSWVRALQQAGHTVSVCLPGSQRSWIGKALLYGQTLTPTYYTPPPLGSDADAEGTISSLPARNDLDEQWVLLNGTPASVVQVGLRHLFSHRGPIDLVVSGPNYGRNSTACFALASGTLGAALEAATFHTRAIAISFAIFDHQTAHDPELIVEACRHGVRIVEALARDWPANASVDVYTVNVPMCRGVSGHKTLFTDLLQNYWSKDSCMYEAVDAAADKNGVVDTDIAEEKLRNEGEAGAPTAIVAEKKVEENDHVDRDQDQDQTGVVMAKGLEHKHFKWAPVLTDIYKSVAESQPGNDGWAVEAGFTRCVCVCVLFGVQPPRLQK